MGAWVLYYLAWTAHILVGGFALLRGRLPEQLTILTIALAIIIEQVVLVSQWSPEPISYPMVRNQPQTFCNVLDSSCSSLFLREQAGW